MKALSPNCWTFRNSLNLLFFSSLINSHTFPGLSDSRKIRGSELEFLIVTSAFQTVTQNSQEGSPTGTGSLASIGDGPTLLRRREGMWGQPPLGLPRVPSLVWVETEQGP